jgi:uncharacterized protein YlxP (DUF503 family)
MPAVGLLTVDLHIPGARSLKDKRRILASVKDRLRKLNVSVAEIDHLDTHQRARLGVAAVASHRDQVDRVLDGVVTEIERRDPGLILATDLQWLS